MVRFHIPPFTSLGWGWKSSWCGPAVPVLILGGVWTSNLPKPINFEILYGFERGWGNISDREWVSWSFFLWNIWQLRPFSVVRNVGQTSCVRTSSPQRYLGPQKLKRLRSWHERLRPNMNRIEVNMIRKPQPSRCPSRDFRKSNREDRTCPSIITPWEWE